MAPHICSVLQTLNASSADKPLLFCKDRQRTGPELVARVWALRRSLEEDIGLRCGDRVVLLALNTDQFLEVLLAVAAAGGVTAPINHRWSTQEALASVQRLRPRLLVVDGSCAELGSQLQAALPEHTTAVCLGDGNFPFPVMARAVSAEYLISRSMYGSSFASEALQAPDDGAALICFTSGTSGTSKGAVISHGALVGQALCKITMAGYRKGDTYLHAAPLFHIGGLSYAIAMLAVGARQGPAQND